MSENLKSKYLDKITSKKISEKEISNSERLLFTFNSALKLFFDSKISKDSKLIDLGCGDGSFVKALKRNQIQCKGYDRYLH